MTINDLGLALRRLRRSPGFTLAVILTLALGIGAASAIFSVTNAAVLRWREALSDSERLVMVWKRESQYGNWMTTPADFRDWHEQSQTLEGLSAFTYRSLTLHAQGDTERHLAALAGAVALVLLLAAVNVAALVLARAEHRSSEFAVRAALGANQRQLMSVAIAEGLVLTALGGALGLGLARVAVDSLMRLAPSEIPRVAETGVAIDLRVLLFTIGLALATALAFTLVPALHASRSALANTARRGAHGATGGRGGNRYRATLMVAEVALSALLLVGAGLLVRSLHHLGTVELGVRSQGLVMLAIEPPLTMANDPVAADAFFASLERLAGRFFPNQDPIGEIIRLGVPGHH